MNFRDKDPLTDNVAENKNELWVMIMCVEMPCWIKERMSRIDSNRIKSNITLPLQRGKKKDIRTENIESWSKWATVGVDHARWICVEQRTWNGGCDPLRLKIDWKTVAMTDESRSLLRNVDGEVRMLRRYHPAFYPAGGYDLMIMWISSWIYWKI